MRGQQIREKVWQWLGEDRRIGNILIILVGIQLLTCIIPQAPAAPSNSLIFSRWLAGMHNSLGPWTKPLSALGFLSLRTSIWMRLTLVGVLLIMGVRVIQLGENWRQLPLKNRWWQSILLLGCGFIIGGWGLQVRLGWIEPRVIVWPEQPIQIPSYGITLSPPKVTFPLWAGRYGFFWLPRGEVTGLEVQAKDTTGKILPLVTHSTPQDKLFIALTETQPDAFFALPDLGYAFRASQRGALVQVEAYQLATGAFLDEITVQEDVTLITENAILQVSRQSLPYLEAVYNPGAPLMAVGLLLLPLGMMVNKFFMEETLT
ncbi:MAG: hypothetical protein JXA33_23435 [Anaerolineae bacterium]|nr:hypothetical protein [Anaerolineae bacterium]